MLDFLNNISGVKVFFIIMISLIFWYITQYIIILILYKPLFQWWKTNNGEQYDKVFNMMTPATIDYSSIMYYMNKLNGGPLNKLDTNQLRFLVGRIFPFMTYIDQNRQQQGILTPKSICKSILLSPSDSPADELFTKWFMSAKRGGLPIKEGALLLYKKSDKHTSTTVPGGFYYTYSFIPNPKDSKDFGVSGIYPQGATDRNDWTGLILEWLGPDWGIAPDKNDINHFVGINPNANYDKWTENTRGDNFLSRYGIFPDSPLITYFCNDLYSTNGMPINAIAFQNLIAPQGDVAGGWIGYLNGMVGSQDDDYYKILYTSVEYPLPKNPTCSKKDVGSGFMAGLSTMFSTASMALMVPPSPASPFIIFGIFFWALASGAYSGFQAGKGTC
jgi:hypothetical protein